MRMILACMYVAVAATAAADPKLASNLDVPTVSYGLDKMPTMLGEPWPILVATPTGIVVEGKAIVSIHNGDVDPSEKEGGSLGIKIPRLTTFVAAYLKAQRKPVTGFAVAMDKQLPYRLLVEILFSLKSAGVQNFAIVGQHGDAGVVPLRLPDKQAGILDAKPADPKGPVKLVVTVMKDKLLLWSISGLEGTLKAPKLSAGRTDTAKLAAGLAEIVKRRFSGKRDDADHAIILMADSAVPMQDVLSVMVAVRATADGKELLFPEVQLSSGFE